MSIIYNNTEIENITYNGNNIDTVNYNNTEVYVSIRTLTINKGSYVDSITINGATYTSNTTLSIKPGTTVTLDCNIPSSITSNGLTTTYSFSNWTGYSTNTNKSFTFTMPNSNITYKANGTYSTSFNWPPKGNIISEATFLNGINSGDYEAFLTGRYVTLTEGSGTHDWLVISVNSNRNYYDLSYAGSIGDATFVSGNENRYWINQPLTANSGAMGFDNPRYLCYQYKSKLSSSIRAKLKTGLNANCGSDLVVILSARQLGCTANILEESDSTSNTAIHYFSSDSRRNIYSNYWTSTSRSDHTGAMITVRNGAFDYTGPANWKGVVPAIRVG